MVKWKKHTSRMFALWVAYILLVGTVVWSAYSTQEILRRQDDSICASLIITTVAEIGILEVFGDQEGVQEETRDQLIEIFNVFEDKVIERCAEQLNLEEGDLE